ncbi:hypothetical protein CC1G_02624 [Coprinopsis cinerea okayama7|uniref:Uncharacterized protein n=1 Tax=Coprinopsis cinerea (strain Okayama-7 / 130 / ATCC MYA-4618 / FGSC 9003) TaxID=240176 RepID=A8PBE1_COPC7|nr:hypothetical protein CC1G_02624 [Coprinopsis cinerea okayama7\|eukprot:XP_001840161.2 hypothetical protein CC1G_02624 [Coprinopsis cinerea okayama7\
MFKPPAALSEGPPLPTRIISSTMQHAEPHLPFFGPNGRVAERPSDGSGQISTAPSSLRTCAGMGCNAVFPAQYPHLRAQLGTLRQARPTPNVGPPRHNGPHLTTSIPPPSSYMRPPPIPASVSAAVSPPVTIKTEPVNVPLPPPSIDALLADAPADEPTKSTDSEDDLGEIDFSYPEASTSPAVTDMKPLVMTIIESTPRKDRASPIHPSRPPTTHKGIHSRSASGMVPVANHKRRKVSHSGPGIPSPLSQELAYPHAQDSSTPRTCSTPECANPVDNPNAVGTGRCSSCIIKDWKSKKARAFDQANRKKGRSVSWAENIAEERVFVKESDEEGDIEMVDSAEESRDVRTPPSPTSPQPSLKLRIPKLETVSPTKLKIKLNLASLNLSPVKSTITGWDSDLSDLTELSSEPEGSSDEVGVASDADSSSSEEDIPLSLVLKEKAKPKPTLKIRIPSLKVQPASTLPTPTPTPPPASSDCTPTPKPLPAPSEAPQSPMPASSTSRLVPASKIAAQILADGGRWCSNAPKCKQVLHREYQWKTCVLCRAKTREYQRKRQNLQGSHRHLEMELAIFKGLAGGSSTESSSISVPSEPTSGSGTRPTSSTSASAPLPTPTSASPMPRPTSRDDFDLAAYADVTGQQLVPGARLCSVKQCAHILPSKEEYPRRMCSRCRKRSNDARVRREKLTPDPAEAARGQQEYMACLQAINKRNDGRCLSIDCGVCLDTGLLFAYCQQCRTRAVRALRRHMKKEGVSVEEIESFMSRIDILTQKARVDGAGSKTFGLASQISSRISSLKQGSPKPKPRPPTPYPEYKGLDALLENFRKLSKDFFEAQIVHYACKLPHSGSAVEREHPQKSGTDDQRDVQAAASPDKAEVKQEEGTPAGAKPDNDSADLSATLFCFDGEFTKVAMDFDIVSRKHAVDQMVNRIKKESQQAAQLLFGPKRFVSLFDYGMVTRFVCARECRIVCPSPTPGGPPEERTKLMQGELEVAVIVDRSHPFFPGERTVVRMRLIG